MNGGEQTDWHPRTITKMAVDTLTFDATRAGFLARAMLERIKRQNLPVGSRLPGMRELAGEYRTSVTTVQAAMRMLHDRGVVECHPSRGAFLKFGPDQASPWNIGVIDLQWRCDLGKTPVHTESWRRRVFKAAIDRIHLEGGQVTMLPLFMEDLQSSAPLQVLEQSVDQLSAVITVQAPRLIEEVERRGMVWAAVNPQHPADCYNFVTADNLGGFARLGRCLAHSGRHRVFILIDQLSTAASKERVVGLYQGFLEAGAVAGGLEVIETGVHNVHENHAFEHVSRRLKAGSPPQAIVAVGDYLAIGAMRAVQAHGLHIPDDVAVIGGTGLELAQYTTPALTVVQQPMERMGWELGNMTLNMLRDKRRRAVFRRVPAPLVFRESFCPDEPLCRAAHQCYERDMTRFEMQIGDDLEPNLLPPVEAEPNVAQAHTF